MDASQEDINKKFCWPDSDVFIPEASSEGSDLDGGSTPDTENLSQKKEDNQKQSTSNEGTDLEKGEHFEKKEDNQGQSISSEEPYEGKEYHQSLITSSNNEEENPED
jgi:hypothetical protein